MIRFAVPQSVTTTGCVPELVDTGWFPKLTEAVLRHTAGAAAMPVPVTFTWSGVVEALDATTTVAERAPDVVGLNAVGTRQPCPGWRLVPQLFANSVKSPGFVPPRESVNVRTEVPLFASVKFCPADCDPTV